MPGGVIRGGSCAGGTPSVLCCVRRSRSWFRRATGSGSGACRAACRRRRRAVRRGWRAGVVEQVGPAVREGQVRQGLRVRAVAPAAVAPWPACGHVVEQVVRGGPAAQVGQEARVAPASRRRGRFSPACIRCGRRPGWRRRQTGARSEQWRVAGTWFFLGWLSNHSMLPAQCGGKMETTGRSGNPARRLSGSAPGRARWRRSCGAGS